jgi:Sec63 Brl domain
VVLLVINIWLIIFSNLDSQNKDPGDISIENRKIFATLLNENFTYKNCPTLLACSEEFRQLKPRSPEAAKQLQAIKTDDSTKELIPAKLVGPLSEVLNMPSLCIILAYMLRMNELDDSLAADLELILSKSTFLIEMMLIVCNMLKMEFSMGRIKKRITAKTVLTLISFSQNIVQGMWHDDEAFLQLPHVDYERLK